MSYLCSGLKHDTQKGFKFQTYKFFEMLIMKVACMEVQFYIQEIERNGCILQNS